MRQLREAWDNGWRTMTAAIPPAGVAAEPPWDIRGLMNELRLLEAALQEGRGATLGSTTELQLLVAALQENGGATLGSMDGLQLLANALLESREATFGLMNEVRDLAAKVQEPTEEIHELIIRSNTRRPVKLLIKIQRDDRLSLVNSFGRTPAAALARERIQAISS
ncbi:hypothetical protein CMQ_1342 [Grosmannia clavigera kw1407]|uniref:Uncharacterized protein n=1 Tax=Grosmannia clavigera (strain kw1407 / UAMH 11150) TaxID=655863 RepID=F0XER0_GROCL|nr:uncharacterized protein CMQ_1342 [Grosmannia clavigera kw1407]EFX04414.1 hypothetical protein CMQ_1342 [Grosmannia clavigera kw1407]